MRSTEDPQGCNSIAPILHQFNQALFVLDIEVLVGLPFVLPGEGMNVRAKSGALISLVKASARGSFRTPQQADGVAAKIGENPARYGRIIFREVAFGQADVFENHALGMRDRDSTDDKTIGLIRPARTALSRRAGRSITTACGGFVLAQALK